MIAAPLEGVELGETFGSPQTLPREAWSAGAYSA
jgi:hypothetical protein